MDKMQEQLNEMVEKEKAFERNAVVVVDKYIFHTKVLQVLSAMNTVALVAFVGVQLW